MTQTFAARNMLVLLAFLAAGLAAFVWWLLSSGNPFAPSVSANREKPVVEAERRPLASAPEKPTSPPAAATEIIKGLGNQLGALNPEPADAGPKFEVARIEPNGESVIAGRAAPGATVELLQDGKVHDRTVADSSGAFVFVPKPLPSGSYNLTLRTLDPDGTSTVSKGTVAVALGPNKGAGPVATLSAPKAPAVVPPKPAASPESRVYIDAVDTEKGGGLRVTGRSTPGSIVRLYLNDAYIATGTASPDGRVGFSILDGVKPGRYRVRIDHMDAAGSMLSRVETVFNAPTLAEAKSPASSRAIASPVQPGLSQAPSSPSTGAPSQAAAPSQSAAPTQSANVDEKIPSPSTTAPRAISETDRQIATSQREPNAPVDPMSPRMSITNEASSKSPAVRETVPPVASGSTQQPGVVVVPKINTKVVIRGDNLWRISEATYGQGKSYTMIFSANRNLIRNPNLIFPDQIFVLPNALPQ